ncbi:MAG TPA: hypothetical protein VLR52_05085 [Bacteroidales bacterium]|nr:hypothetical protein [Bacteroidales bacterium]
MKTISLFFLMMLAFISCSFAQSTNSFDSIFAVVNGHSVTIHQDSARRNCCVTPVHNIVIIDHTINWYMTDTTGIFCGCMCFFDYSVTIDTLDAGDYTVHIWEAYDIPGFDTIYYQGSTIFSINLPAQPIAHTYSSTGTDCHNVVILDASAKREFTHYFSLINRENQITLQAKGTEKINAVRLTDLSGKELFSRKYYSEDKVSVSFPSARGIFFISINGRWHEKIQLR